MKLEKNTTVEKQVVTLGDVADLVCANQSVVNRLKMLKLFGFQHARKGKHRCAARKICSVIEVVEKIHEVYPGLEIENLGETDFIVEYSTKGRDAAPLLILKVGLISAITFCGSAFSIMTFNNDVSTTKLFSQFYELLTGQPSDGFTILELTYSLGLALGIVTFFNHLGGRRITKDPTPIEVEMRQYEDDVETTLIQSESRARKTE